MPKKPEFVDGPYKLNNKGPLPDMTDEEQWVTIDAPEHTAFAVLVSEMSDVSSAEETAQLGRTNRLFEKSKYLFYFCDKAVEGTLTDDDVTTVCDILTYIRVGVDTKTINLREAIKATHPAEGK